MAQNIFSGDTELIQPQSRKPRGVQPQQPLTIAPERQPSAGGFGNVAPNLPQAGAAPQIQASPAPEYARHDAGADAMALGSGGEGRSIVGHFSEGQNQGNIPSPIHGFGGGYREPVSEFSQGRMARWAPGGVMDNLLAQGTRNSAEGSAISRDLFQREKAAELNQRYIDAANSQIHPQQIERTQNVDLMKTLGVQLETMPRVIPGPVDAHGKPTTQPNPEYLSLQQTYQQLLGKLGLAQEHPQTGAPAGVHQQPQQGASQGQPQAGAPNPNNPNVAGFGGSVQSLLRGMAPSLGGTAGWMGASKLAGMIPGVGGKIASTVGPLIGAYMGAKGASTAADSMMPEGQDAMAAHPWARMAGEFLGVSPAVKSYMNKRAMEKNAGNTAGEVVAESAVQAPQTPVVQMRPGENFNPPQQPMPQPQPSSPSIAGFGGQPHTPRYNPNMDPRGIPKIRQPSTPTTKKQ